jgi:hypothetical protein
MRMFGSRSVLNKLVPIGVDVRAVLGEGNDRRNVANLGEFEALVTELQGEIELLRRALEWTE